MSTTLTFYCSCSTCRQIRNYQPKHYRYFNFLYDLLTCSRCLPKRRYNSRDSSTFSRMTTIKFRDVDITNKHCSKHVVLAKASRPNLTRLQHEELRQRVRDANQRWRLMSVLPTDFIDFIYVNKDFLPLCTVCYENLSPTTFNLCLNCITTLVTYQQRR